MSMTPSRLLSALQTCLATQPSSVHAPQRFIVAYSGGLDSHCLLHLLSRCRAQLAVGIEAVHVHHGLQPQADRWVEHCRQVCRQLDIPLTVLQVEARAARGESPEAAARQARYAALQEIIKAGDILLTAQHRDDQAETLLLQLFRGSGSRGQAAMPWQRAFGAGAHWRPLLEVGRDELREYAEHQQLHWVDDPSNLDTCIDRNYLRHEVMPVLQQRWPAIQDTLGRVASQQAENEGLLEALAALDMQGLVGTGQSLSLPGLAALDAARQRNVLRHWLRQQGLALPSRRKLLQVQHDMLGAAQDRNPHLEWSGVELRRYRGRLYAMPPLRRVATDWCRDWNLQEKVVLPWSGQLSSQPAVGEGLRADIRDTPARIQLRLRQGGERCRPAGRDRHHSLKKLFQEAGIPPWQRQRIPLVFVGDELAAVPGLCVCEPFAAPKGGEGLYIDWQ
ncbi:tRNA lysidine(34) synthetase TilS [Sulfuriflexus sp.]|uniref:tRNA lysidine(34) synthetase TilS n=1 Tax=Sulfuriflexus sp. TaxID=2015443 RepID=UPI0028CDC2A9|nr:tRNA lysidine(34) synthetase TilS [Sulfuriflexus sp.]MDT8402969.1 tRNA lysidine(34) synthetase TilS [Sulfuriflexus sp.]